MDFPEPSSLSVHTLEATKKDYKLLPEGLQKEAIHIGQTQLRSSIVKHVLFVGKKR